MESDFARSLACLHGARAIDMRQERSQINIAIDGPGMSVSHLELVTSLSIWQGHDVVALKKIADDIQAQVKCGHRRDSSVAVAPIQTSLGPVLQVAVGPLGMYTSNLTLKTRSGTSFKELLDRCFTSHAEKGLSTTEYIAVLFIVAGDGHHHALNSAHQ